MKGFNRGYGRLAGRFRNCLGKKCQKDTITTLSKNCNRGRKKICKVTGDRKLCARMASLGVYPGNEIEVICAESGSQCVLRVHGGTVSVDAVTSDNILVESI